MPLIKIPFALRAAALILATVAAAQVHAQLPFFPGAEGFGGSFTGTAPAGGWFSNATVYHVTTTADTLAPDGKPAVGTLRGAFYDAARKQMASNVLVVFDVGGTFQLTQGSLDIKTVNNIYIAGQTAPSPVTVYGNTTQITKSNNTVNSNVVLRYMTFRKGTGDGEDAITFAGGNGAGQTVATNMILDHVSASWAEDEDLSVANNNTNVTVQYSIIADALTNSHAYGSLIRPQIDSSVTFHHNLYASNASRQARFGTYNAETLTADFRNNVIYNWRDRASYTGGSSEAEQEFTDVNYVGNYLVAGPNTTGPANRAFSVDKNVTSRVYQSGNFVDADKQLNPGGVPNGSDLGWGAFAVSTPVTDQTMTQMVTPFATAPVTTQTAPAAYEQVLDHVGNFWWNREAIDQRIINNVKTNTGPSGGVGAAAPNATELANLLAAPTTTRPAGWDSDADGMPNAWELAHGLNPNSAADNRLDFDGDGYVNVVEYLNEAGEFPAPAPIVFNGATNTRYAQITNWRTNDGGVTAGSNWQPSKYDASVINGGTVAIDAIGQHAGVLQVAPAVGNAATLNVTAGWIDVAERLEVGAAGSGTVNHTGGLVLADEVLLGGGVGASGEYHLSGSGVLRTGRLAKGANGGAFNFTGGTLSADAVDFDLVNNGGVIAAGESPGLMQIDGDLALNSGVLEIEIGGTQLGQFDRLEVDGTADLGGTLRVALVNLGGGAYQPQLGDSIPFLAASGGAGGMFDAFELPALASGLAWQLSPGNVTVFLNVVADAPLSPADFNGDGFVNGDDLAVWRIGFGSTGQTNNATGDADGNGAVDGADFLVWQRGFTSADGAATSVAVPEPSSLLLCVIAALSSRGSTTRRSGDKWRTLHGECGLRS
ncbi:hypothetical protein [Lacipirellula parvula]|uniref:Probable pectate lyase C n=1 Tax=Lacipirellula parvula TaxID=2650471 RepID=A0A5K7XG14_9BACT|nr:hypothetical protein [Lacipirellula parvula]BBO35804.1 hypothetical protein PLANPX_5416 [Lacipirellula parvula]